MCLNEMVLKKMAVGDPLYPDKDLPHHKVILQMGEQWILLALIVDLIAFLIFWMV